MASIVVPPGLARKTDARLRLVGLHPGLVLDQHIGFRYVGAGVTVRRNRSPKDFLPLRPSVLHVLMALSEGPRHGYAIKQEVESSTDGIVRLGPGTLYETLQRLEASELIREVRSPSKRQDHSQRRYYDLTRLGRSVLDTELARLRDVVSAGRSRRASGSEAT